METWKIDIVLQTAWCSRQRCYCSSLYSSIFQRIRSFFSLFLSPACPFLPPFSPDSLLCSYMGVCHAGRWEPLLRTDSSFKVGSIGKWQSHLFLTVFGSLKSKGYKSWDDAGLMSSILKEFYPLNYIFKKKRRRKGKEKKPQRNKRKKKTNDRDEKPHHTAQHQQPPSRGYSIRERRGCPWVSGLLDFMLAASWVSLEDALCLSPAAPSTTARSSLPVAMNYTRAFGQHLLGGLSPSLLPSHSSRSELLSLPFLVERL